MKQPPAVHMPTLPEHGKQLALALTDATFLITLDGEELNYKVNEVSDEVIDLWAESFSQADPETAKALVAGMLKNCVANLKDAQDVATAYLQISEHLDNASGQMKQLMVWINSR